MNIHTSSNDNFTKLNTVTVLLQITFLSITYDVTWEALVINVKKLSFYNNV